MAFSSQTPKDRARAELVRAIEALGYPAEFGEVLAGELGGEKSMQRMTAYLRQARPTSPEQIVDEMLAIVEQRQRWAQQHASQHANDAITAFYNRPRED